MLNTMKQHAENMNRNSGFPTFGVIALRVLTIFVFAPQLKNRLTYFHEISHKC